MVITLLVKIGAIHGRSASVGPRLDRRARLRLLSSPQVATPADCRYFNSFVTLNGNLFKIHAKRLRFFRCWCKITFVGSFVVASAAQYVFDASGENPTAVGTYYYRYTEHDLLTYGLTPQEVASAGGISAVRSMDVADLAPYAGSAFEYSGQIALNARVSSATVDGLYEYNYSYLADLGAAGGGGANTWSNETVETRPDGSSCTVFTNSVCETLLTDLADASGNHWVTYNEYGTDAYDAYLLVKTADPSAIDMTCTGDGQLFPWGGGAGGPIAIGAGGPLAAGNGTFTFDASPQGYDPSNPELGVQYNSTGLIQEYAYGSSTTAGETNSGNALGCLQSQSLVDGTSGSPVEIDSYQYYAHSGSVAVGNGETVSVTVYPTASTTDYPVAGEGGNETDYNYTWWDLPGTDTPSAQVQQETTALPIVTTAQNGPGGTTHWTEKEVFDASGDLIWQEDADGNLTYNAYDSVTGLLTETIADVSVDPRPTDSGIPDPPEAIPSTGINATTDYRYDPLGRQTQELDPEFTDDAGDLVRTATETRYIDTPAQSGNRRGRRWAGHGGPHGQRLRGRYAGHRQPLFRGGVRPGQPDHRGGSNLEGRISDDIQAEDGTATTIADTTLADLSSTSFASNSTSYPWSRWTHDDYNPQSGQLVDEKVYSRIAGSVYSETQYGYDSLGRENRLVDPSGDITRTVYDARGLTLSVYVGTADAGATDTDPTGGRWGCPPSTRPTTCCRWSPTSTTTALAAATAT